MRLVAFRKRLIILNEKEGTWFVETGDGELIYSMMVFYIGESESEWANDVLDEMIMYQGEYTAIKEISENIKQYHWELDDNGLLIQIQEPTDGIKGALAVSMHKLPLVTY